MPITFEDLRKISSESSIEQESYVQEKTYIENLSPERMKFSAFLVLKLYVEKLCKGRKTACLQNKRTNNIEILGFILKKNSALLEMSTKHLGMSHLNNST